MKRNLVLYSIRRKVQLLGHKFMSPEFMSELYFRIVLGYNLNLKNPRSFNEKLQWLKLYYWPNDKNAVKCADKYAVREYIRDIGREDLLNEIIFSWEDAKEIKWEKLPNQFVLKCNHGCGYNIICKDKSKMNEKEVVKKLDKWMHEDFSAYNEEPHYGKIHRKIICEKFLDGEVINYNIYVFNGKVKFLSVAGGLGEGKDEYLTYYNPDGTIASFRNKSYPPHADKLSSLLPKMIKTAEFLAKDFPMCRVDLFDYKGRIILSELTFTPGGGLIPFDPIESDMMLGEQLDISNLVS